MPNEQTMTITETAPDGTETTVEITTTKPDDTALGEDKSLVEEVIEAIFDTDDVADETIPTDTAEPAIYELTPTDEELSTDSVEFNLGSDSFPSIDIPPASETIDAAAVESESDTSEADLAAAEQQAHLDAAKEAQTAADEFVAQGDYSAAEQARETAENEAWEAGDQSVLSGSSSAELESAAAKQEDAEYYRGEQAYDASHGDYEAAKEDAQNAAFATGDADFKAGGPDHTEQSDKDVGNLDWAVWDQKNADESARNAEEYAAEGDFDNAARNADQAESYQALADEYGAAGNPADDSYQIDTSSEVASGGTYDSDFDAASVDTGFDSSTSTAADTSYDTSTDDV